MKMLLLLVFLLCFLLCLNNGQQQTKIDVHDHLNRNSDPTLFDDCAQSAMDQMSKVGVDFMFIMPEPFPYDDSSVQPYNASYLQEVTNTFPDHFYYCGGGGTLNIAIQKSIITSTTPNQQQLDDFRDTAVAWAKEGAVCFGEMASLHLSLGPGHPYEYAPADHPYFLELMDVAEQFDVSVDLHMEAVWNDFTPLPSSLRSPPNPPYLNATIPALERLLIARPKSKLVWDHVGWDNVGERNSSMTRSLLERYPNLYMSIKVSTDCVNDPCYSNRPTDLDGNLREDWKQLFEDMSNRFFLGGDQIYIPPDSKQFPESFGPTWGILSQLSHSAARAISSTNVQNIYPL